MLQKHYGTKARKSSKKITKSLLLWIYSPLLSVERYTFPHILVGLRESLIQAYPWITEIKKRESPNYKSKNIPGIYYKK